MSKKRLIWLIFLAVLLSSGIAVWLAFRSDIKAAQAAVDGYETVRVETGFGPVELVDQGTGFPVLAIHGTGGGFDQGAILAAALLRNGYRVIAPSRFGYLGTPVPEQNDAAAQADAFAEMLDALAIDRTVVMGGSAGAITALAFASRHPDRTAALLVMVPAYYPETAAPPPWPWLAEKLVTAALQSDFVFWAALKVAPGTMASAILATDPAIIEAARPEERARLDAFMATLLPVSTRAEGLILDARNTAAPVEIDLAAITAPTFIASAEDDGYRTAEAARMLADHITGSELLITPDGGHIWINRADEVDAAVLAFLNRVLPQ